MCRWGGGAALPPVPLSLPARRRAAPICSRSTRCRAGRRLHVEPTRAGRGGRPQLARCRQINGANKHAVPTGKAGEGGRGSRDVHWRGTPGKKADLIG